MKKKIFTSLGLMSGTSMDGVDLSLIKTDGDTEFTPILDNYFEFDHKLKEKLINLRDEINNPEDLEKYSKKIQEVEKEFTLFNIKIVSNVLQELNNEVDLIGFHGQTIFHDSNNKITKQLGDGKLFSQMVKKIVVNNFRQKDLDNNGLGAPLTPLFHMLISKKLEREKKINLPLNIINIGGITNVTQVIKFSDSIDTNLNALDIGPGNCLIDEWVRKNSKKQFDDNGDIAKNGKVNDLILNQAIDNFEILSFEKSLDVKDFDISFVKGLSLEDGCATLTKFTSILIANGLEYLSKANKSFPVNNLFCGGGRKNSFLINSIKEKLGSKNIKLENINLYGLDGDFIESQAFAYLSVRTLLNLPISFPSTTKCKAPTVGGEINKNF